MTTTDKFEIPLSKTKLTKLLIGSVAFVAIGFWFVINPPEINNPVFGNRTVILIAGIAAILFFSLSGFIGFKKLRDNKPGLIIDEKGITDNASGVAAGYIPWSDIKEIKTTQVFNQKFLMILVNNPNDYIKRQTSVIKRKGMALNYKTYGSPISISASGVKCNFDELKNILQTQLNKYKT